MNQTENIIHIRPTTSVYATYRRLSYKPWFAIAEFVDNSTQSYSANKKEIIEYHSKKDIQSHFTVEINYNNTTNTLTIYDNAFGMNFAEFQRALVLDSPPADISGRSEFGMGLKTAACWFGSYWSVESTQLGSNRLFVASIDVNELAKSKSESIICSERTVDESIHFTKITIRDVHQPIRGRTVTKVHEHLSSIYREDIRSGEVSILWGGIPLTFEDPEIYEEIDAEGNKKIWKKDIEFAVHSQRTGTDLKVNGWIGIRKQGKQKDAGFVLMRRGRVILGGPDTGYKPNEVFGQANSFRSQRLIGELYLNDWPVTQAKDGFDWTDGLEESFIDELLDQCKEYADKAEIIRVIKNVEPKPVGKPEMESVSEKTKQVFQNEDFAKWVQDEIESKREQTIQAKEATQPQEEKQQEKEKLKDSHSDLDKLELKNASLGPVSYTLNMDRTQWTFKLYWQNAASLSHWMSVTYPKEDEIEIYLNISHPFFAAYVNDPGLLELLQKLVISLALAEKMARISSNDSNYSIEASDIRTFMDKILTRISLIKEVD